MRWIERISGLLSGVSGLLGLGYLLKIIAVPSAPPIRPETLVFLGLIAVMLVGIAVGATVDSRTSRPVWGGLLRAATGALVVFALLGLFSVGPFLVPSIVLAIVASGISWSQRPRPTQSFEL